MKQVAPALPGLLASLCRNHQTALHDSDSDLLVDLEASLLQPEAAQFDAGDDAVAGVGGFAERRVVIGGDGGEAFSSRLSWPMIGVSHVQLSGSWLWSAGPGCW